MQKLLLFVLAIAVLTGCSQHQLNVAYTDDGLWINEGSKPVFFYQATPKALDGKYARSNYIHPLYDLDGMVITEDFPADHVHHRGIFWTWHQTWIGDTRIGDAWLCEDFSWNVVEAKAEKNDNGAMVLHTRVFWQSPLWTDSTSTEIPFMEEKAIITVYPSAEDFRCIDFSISLRALEENLKIGGSEDSKGYSGFSPRVLLGDDAVFTDANGAVEPQTNAVTAGAWVDINRTLNNKKAGFAIMQHPSNPQFVQGWILRTKASMQNAAFPGSEPTPISTEEPTVLKYRIVIHGEQTDLQKIYDEYAAL